MTEHNKALADAFDGQAEKFEKAPVQSDRAALARLVAFADLPPGARLLDVGCGPGLVCEAFLEEGASVVGVDLSAEMVRRARERNDRFGERAEFVQGSLYDDISGAPFDAVVSRYVLHHVEDARAFLARQVALLRPGGTLVLSDHVTDPDPARADWHREVERDRDRTHSTNLTTGQVVDLMAASGLTEIRASEEPFTLDFDEWFDRGTPRATKAESLVAILQGPQARGFRATAEGGAVRIDCVRVIARGTWGG